MPNGCGVTIRRGVFLGPADALANRICWWLMQASRLMTAAWVPNVSVDLPQVQLLQCARCGHGSSNVYLKALVGPLSGAAGAALARSRRSGYWPPPTGVVITAVLVFVVVLALDWWLRTRRERQQTAVRL